MDPVLRWRSGSARRALQGRVGPRRRRRVAAGGAVTSSYLRLAVLDLLLLGAGLAVLHGLGFVRSGRDALRHSAVALVAGWAALGIVESRLLVLGAPLS